MPHRHGSCRISAVDLKQLEYFVAVGQAGSSSRAADALGMTQPALSRQIRALEVELRETLLERHGRGVALTEPGRRLLARGREVIQLMHDTRQELGALRGEAVGQIILGLPPSLARRLTVQLIEAFQAHLPHAKLVVVEAFSSHIGEWLAAGRVDLGLVYNPEPHAQLAQEPVLEETLCLVGPAGALPGPRVTLAEVAQLPLVMPQWGHSFRRLMEARALLAGVKLQVAWEVSSVPTILDIVRRGHGFAALTRSAVAAGTAPGEVDLAPIVDPAITSTLCMAWSSQRRRDALHLRTSQMLAALCRDGG